MNDDSVVPCCPKLKVTVNGVMQLSQFHFHGTVVVVAERCDTCGDRLLNGPSSGLLPNSSRLLSAKASKSPGNTCLRNMLHCFVGWDKAMQHVP